MSITYHKGSKLFHIVKPKVTWWSKEGNRKNKRKSTWKLIESGFFNMAIWNLEVLKSWEFQNFTRLSSINHKIQILRVTKCLECVNLLRVRIYIIWSGRFQFRILIQWIVCSSLRFLLVLFAKNHLSMTAGKGD